MRNIVFNAISSLLPGTRLFIIKEIIARIIGFNIGAKVKINKNVKVLGRGNVFFKNNIWIGYNNIFVVPEGCSVIIGENCDIGPQVLFQCGSHVIGDSFRRAGLGMVDSIEVGDGSWIGARVTLLPGAKIGRGSIVAAGAVVKGGIYPDNVLIAGVPGSIVKNLNT